MCMFYLCELCESYVSYKLTVPDPELASGDTLLQPKRSQEVEVFWLKKLQEASDILSGNKKCSTGAGTTLTFLVLISRFIIKYLQCDCLVSSKHSYTKFCSLSYIKL